MNGQLSLCSSCKHWNGMCCQSTSNDREGVFTGCAFELREPFTTTNIILNDDLSNFKADSWGNIPPIETELYINNEPVGKHYDTIHRLLTEAIALSQISGENTKAQMRDKIIEAREIVEELKRGK